MHRYRRRYLYTYMGMFIHSYIWMCVYIHVGRVFGLLHVDILEI